MRFHSEKSVTHDGRRARIDGQTVYIMRVSPKYKVPRPMFPHVCANPELVAFEWVLLGKLPERAMLP